MARPQAAPIARDWLGKTLAGILLGFTLALGCSALFVWLAASLPQSARSQLAMWLLAPVWIGVLGGVFFFHSGKQAWLWLGAANLLVFLIPIVGRHF
ncbi:hypothetical protein GTP23_04385 [Pseudoduganella sp. FT93W]|uniref:DUF3649 domain-containing protein n=1 Tax=Duganella fentianensis TaxID=2692177 RepID=A0A845I0R1_9BURK|nr:hypothetical protein [Duganella fentianensis]MYN44308.1 hypothetical protein [Duganella fentianensis]